LWQGIANAFDIPLRQSLFVHMVDDRADLPNAIALNSFAVNGARVAGPAFAGLLIAATSEAVCFAINAISFVAVFVSLATIAFPREREPAAGAGFAKSWMEGFRYVTGFPPARALMGTVAILAWTIIPYVSLMPVYAKDIHGGGPGTLGLLLGTAGAIAARIGVQATFVLNGLVAVAAALVLARKLPSLRRAMRPVYAKLGLLPEAAD
jgi:thiol:disulfide interchange protein